MSRHRWRECSLLTPGDGAPSILRVNRLSAYVAGHGVYPVGGELRDMQIGDLSVGALRPATYSVPCGLAVRRLANLRVRC